MTHRKEEILKENSMAENETTYNNRDGDNENPPPEPPIDTSGFKEGLGDPYNKDEAEMHPEDDNTDNKYD